MLCDVTALPWENIMNLLIKSRYKPARGGHAPSDLREAFEQAVEAYCEWAEGDPEPIVDLRGKDVPISRICGLLWSCIDAAPSDLRRTMEEIDADFRGFTYATAARSLKALIVAAND